MNLDELLVAMDSLAAGHKGKRGRPPEDTIAAINTGMRRLAFEVFTLECALGGQRGHIKIATNTVASRYHIKPATLKRAVSRHRDLRDIAHSEYRRSADWMKLRRRLRGFSPSAREWLAPLPARRVLRLLRAAGIDGTRPVVFDEEAVERRFNVPKLPQ